MLRSHSSPDERIRKVRSSKLYQTLANNQFDQADTYDEDEYILSSNEDILMIKRNEPATQESEQTPSNQIILDGKDSIEVEAFTTVPAEEIISENVNNSQSTISSSSLILIEEHVQTSNMYVHDDVHSVSPLITTSQDSNFTEDLIRSESLNNESLESENIPMVSRNLPEITDNGQSSGLRIIEEDDGLAPLREFIEFFNIGNSVTSDSEDSDFNTMNDEFSDQLVFNEDGTITIPFLLNSMFGNGEEMLVNVQIDSFVQPELSAQSSSINLDTFPKLNNSDCSICLEGGIACILPCSHRFHENCLQKWFETNNTCPLCRRIY